MATKGWSFGALVSALKDAAFKDTGTAAGTVAAGDDSRIVGAAQKSSNLSDLVNKPTARTNLGLSTGAVATVQTGNYDNTANLLLTNGSWGAGVNNGVPRITSTNKITGTGWYTLFGTGTDTPSAGGPPNTGNTILALEVVSIYSGSAWCIAYSANLMFTGYIRDITNPSLNEWTQVYSPANKPSPADLGAFNIAGDTIVHASSTPIILKGASAGVVSQVVQGRGSDNSLKWYVGVGSNSSDNVMLNNYKSNITLTLGESAATMNAPLNVTGRVTPTDLGNFDARYQLNNTGLKSASGWQKDSQTGIIFQWGGGAIAGSGSRLNFPIGFPSACVRVIATDIGEDHRSFGAAPASTTQAVFYPEQNGTSCSYLAIGY